MKDVVRRSKATWRAWSRSRRTGVVAVVVLAFVFLPLGVCALALRLQYTGEPSELARTRNRDAVWLGHAWVDGRKTGADIAALTAQLAGTGIRDLYVHTGPLEHDGSLPAGVHPRARWLVAAVHRSLPQVRVQAWLGDVVAPEKVGLRLDSAAVRGEVAASAGQGLDLGFDGVHLDLEPVRSGSAGFLRVLDQVREVTAARRVVLSIAAPQIDPLPGLHRAGILVAGHGKYWSQGYFAETARRVDQIAVMSYDTALPVESLYGGYVAQQTALALEVTPDDVDLLIGLPAYWENNPDHWGSAETVAAAVRGARLALDREAPDRQTFGLALYADFTAMPEHWTAYKQGWCPGQR